ncbi:tyrosine recombinase [Lasius niger]|uniref:Tyrosine recombinase n=1 Tax=Lasius niger TaxID=67767 RepID=A0A0J7K7F5_LASNI|nr:tyrosine recombinase [Lasius niger]
MGKSAHKLRKRRSSPSVDRLAGIEEKLSRLLGVLTHTTGENQVGIALCALGEAISDLLKPTVQSSLGPETRLAVTKVSEGAKILANLFYRLFLTKRAPITPVINLVAKNTADTIPVDDFLFGTSFGEEMKKANSIEKSSRDIVRVPLTVSREVQQPIKQPTQSAPTRSGNVHAPRRSPGMEQDFPGSREIIRQVFLIKGTPASALDATLASITASTVAQYTKPLRLWWYFSLSDIGWYTTLNTYRSAISLLSSDEIGSHPLVKRFFRGVAALKPQRPRYDFIWDPPPVIAHLVSLYPHENLSLELISRKLVTLLALTTAQRMQTLAAIQISNVVISDSLVTKIPARLKTSGIGKSQPLLVFKPFLDRPELWVFSLVKFYIELTYELRKKNCDAFFISFRSPYNPVSSQTIGRWVKLELDAAGIDITIFPAHSTRHASTSLAANKGINLDKIRRTAG